MSIEENGMERRGDKETRYSQEERHPLISITSHDDGDTHDPNPTTAMTSIEPDLVDICSRWLDR